MPEAGPRYWAFLSYSHADLRIALRLHRALEGYVVPRRLVGRPTPAGPAPLRLRPIFRDLDEMGAGGSLSARLKAALDASACLIVICSPAAAASPWVNEEIRRFKAERGEDRILSVIVGGEPFASERPGGEALECFPKALRQRHADGERIEPIAADLRRGRPDTLRAAVLKLVAGVLDIELDELVQRDAQRRNRRLVALTSVFGAIAATMAALALMAWNAAEEAQRQRGQAERLVEFMIHDLRDKLQPAGRLDILDDIGGQAQKYYAAENSGSLDAGSLGQRARVLHLLGDIRTQRGDFPAARALFQQAARSTGEVLKRRPNDPQAIFDHAQSVAYLGEVAFASGDYAGAQAQFEAYQALARRLAAIDPKNPDWQREVEDADTNVGVALFRQGRADEAARDFEDALAVSRRLAAVPAPKRSWLWDEAQNLAWLADAQLAQGRLDAALANRQAEGRIYSALIAASPHDNDAAMALATSRAETARLQLESGGARAATLTLQVAAAQLDPLVRQAPDNTIYQGEALTILRLLAQALLQDGKLHAAGGAAARAVDLCEAQVRAADAHHDEAVAWRGQRLGAARIVSLKIGAAAAQDSAGQRLALAAAPGEAARLRALVTLHPQNGALAITAAEAALLAGDFENLDGRATQARSDWAWSRQVLSQTLPTGADTDPAPVLLRQAAYRLRFLRPPAGPLPPSIPDHGAPPGSGAPKLANYRW